MATMDWSFEMTIFYNLSGPCDLNPEIIVSGLVELCKQAAETNVIRIMNYDEPVVVKINRVGISK